ncbi:MAG TPA: acetoacetate decarboxylase family protein [Steroidobacteraceae bacterium]|nr:acetoacetate decarboxylase family protein [Steroidobacteraceae bacterium]
MPSETRGQLMPLWSPPFGGAPYPMLSAELLLVEFEADRAEIERITPPPLEPVEHDRLSAFVGRCSQLSHSLSYHEVAIIQPVKYEGRRGVTVPYIWTSTDTAMLAGRELYGMPKMICDDDQIRKHGNELAGYLRRNGNLMLELSMCIDEPATIDSLPFGPDFTFVRHFPSPDPEWPALRQLIWIQLQDFVMHSCWRGRGHIRIHHPFSSGLGRLEPRRVTGAWHGTFSWTLPWAKVLKEWKD